MALDRGGHKPVDVVGYAHIAGMNTADGQAFLLGKSDDALRCACIDVATQDACAMARKHQRATLPDAAADPGNDRNFSVQAIRQQGPPLTRQVVNPTQRPKNTTPIHSDRDAAPAALALTGVGPESQCATCR